MQEVIHGIDFIHEPHANVIWDAYFFAEFQTCISGTIQGDDQASLGLVSTAESQERVPVWQSQLPGGTGAKREGYGYLVELSQPCQPR